MTKYALMTCGIESDNGFEDVILHGLYDSLDLAKSNAISILYKDLDDDGIEHESDIVIEYTDCNDGIVGYYDELFMIKIQTIA